MTPEPDDGSQTWSVRHQQCFEVSDHSQMSQVAAEAVQVASHAVALFLTPMYLKPGLSWQAPVHPHGDGPEPPTPWAQALPVTWM